MNRSDTGLEVRLQGHLDGLCGVYSLVHFFLRYRKTDSSAVGRRIFLRVLEGLERADAFTPQKIRNGFGQGKLRQAFEHVADVENFKVTAVPINSYAKRHHCKDVLGVLKTLGSGDAILAHLPSPQHWVLAHSPSPQTFWIDDSAEGECRRVRNNCITGLSDGKKIERRFHLKKGLVLLNAQTH